MIVITGGGGWELEGEQGAAGVQENCARIELSEFHLPCHCFLACFPLYFHTNIYAHVLGKTLGQISQ